MGLGLFEQPHAAEAAWSDRVSNEKVLLRGHGRGWWHAAAWVPIALLIIATAWLWAINPIGNYNLPNLVFVLNIVTRASAWILVSYLMGRSFLASGAPGTLLFGIGVTYWGLGGVLGSLYTQDDFNAATTITTMALWLSGICHLAGAAIAMRFPAPFTARKGWLVGTYAAALVTVALITAAAWAKQLPVFFIAGWGGQPVRSVMLASALAMFVLTA